MPTYDYVCEGCEHQFEHFQSMTSRRLRKCPECGERKLQRLVGAGAGLIFKGSGFYETDYKRAGASARSGGSGASSSDTSKSETKTASTDDGGSSKDE
jgi:putative FmdB family regulatory protein